MVVFVERRDENGESHSTIGNVVENLGQIHFGVGEKDVNFQPDHFEAILNAFSIMSLITGDTHDLAVIGRFNLRIHIGMVATATATAAHGTLVIVVIIVVIVVILVKSTTTISSTTSSASSLIIIIVIPRDDKNM